MADIDREIERGTVGHGLLSAAANSELSALGDEVEEPTGQRLEHLERGRMGLRLDVRREAGVDVRHAGKIHLEHHHDGDRAAVTLQGAQHAHRRTCGNDRQTGSGCAATSAKNASSDPGSMAPSKTATRVSMIFLSGKRRIATA